MMGGSPLLACLVPLKVIMASAVAWSVTLTNAMGGLFAGRLTVTAVMQAARKPRAQRKSPT